MKARVSPALKIITRSKCPWTSWSFAEENVAGDPEEDVSLQTLATVDEEDEDFPQVTATSSEQTSLDEDVQIDFGRKTRFILQMLVKRQRRSFICEVSQC